jgi:hypothetical protein
MSIKEQWEVMKRNWLIILVLLVLLFFISGSNFRGEFLGNLPGVSNYKTSGVGYEDEGEYAVGRVASEGFYPPGSGGGGDFVPDILERQITKTAWMTSEIKRGEFSKKENELKGIVSRYSGLILNEDVNSFGPKERKSVSGTYRVKVVSEEYDSFISDIRGIGEIESFSEDADDITGRIDDLEIDIKAERERLERYKLLFEEAKTVDEKIRLTDLIFNQERRVEYLEEALENQGLRVSYSSVSVTLREKQSDFVDATFIGVREIVRSFVGSVNSVVLLIVWAIPYLFGIWLVVWIVKKVRKK